MTQTHSRYIQVGDWYFELKAVRALKVDEYGKPYQAIANCNINGNKMYVDGLLTKNGEEFTKQDFLSIYHFCQKIGIDVCTYHRFQNGESVHRELVIDPNKKIDLTSSYPKDNKADNEVEQQLEPIPMRLVK
ncbi:hypothetical protein [Thalassotalea marina]|uniref:Uncharacterized protein n=1 Tax=Thalassotalea marina TaxID=1673741 RepID=A0A919BDP0_9GAMM|nr:hypothetical protein [Thalassotalea marina]GHF83649.1 hypothetical protein GCM10017161_08680 [Thalassotalea marina]